MMEAKDTVIDEEEIKRIVMIQALAKDEREFLAHYDMDDGVESSKTTAKAQAEITFPLGKQEGIREVVEWVKSNGGWILNYNTSKPERIWNWSITHDDWQAKLKEWGIEL